jgi:restriction system protein
MSNNVFGCFVGNGGCFLKEYNSQQSPYPPTEKTEGFIAVGWGNIGTMLLYENNYKGFESQFLKVYPNCTVAQAGCLWRFAFEAKVGDWVISPSSATGVTLIGEIISEYLSDFDEGEFGFYPYRHLRKVRWHHVIEHSDSRAAQFSRIGQLTFFKSNKFSVDDLKAL